MGRRVLVEQGSRDGVSPIVAVDLKDKAGNHRTIWRSGLKAAGLPSGIEVISTPDQTRPRLTSFTVEPVSVDTRTRTQTVTFTATATDDLSGIGSVDFFGSMDGRSITNAVDGDFVGLDPVAGMPGTFRGTIDGRTLGRKRHLARQATVRGGQGRQSRLLLQRAPR